MASRGLPGFLRRSIRADSDDYDLEDEDDEESVASAASAASDVQKAEALSTSNNNTSSEANGKSQSQEQEQTKSSSGILMESSQEQDVSRHTTFSADHSVSSRASMPPSTVPKIPQPSPMNRQISEPKLTHASQTSQGDGNSSLFSESHRSKSSSAPAPSPDSQGPFNPPTTIKPRPKTYRELQFDKMFAANVVSMNDLKSLAWNGIPSQYRPQSWKILLGYLPTNASRRQQTLQKKRAEYKDAISQHYDIDDNSRTIQEQEVLRQVLVDVPRTAPTVKLFRDERIKRLLSRILYTWAMRHPASSYVQGINDLVMPLIVTFLADRSPCTSTSGDESAVNNDRQMEIINGNPEQYQANYDEVIEGRIMEAVSDERLYEIEADCYWCLTNLLAGIQDHYTSDQPGVQRMVLRLEELVNRIDADLCSHLRDTGIEFMQFAFKWMNCLLLREFNLKCVIRLWDTYISEKDGFEGFHVYVCAAFLCQFSNQLQAMSFDELFGFMQAMPTEDWGDTEIEMLLSQAYVLSTLFGGSDAHLGRY